MVKVEIIIEFSSRDPHNSYVFRFAIALGIYLSFVFKPVVFYTVFKMFIMQRVFLVTINFITRCQKTIYCLGVTGDY